MAGTLKVSAHLIVPKCRPIDFETHAREPNSTVEQRGIKLKMYEEEWRAEPRVQHIELAQQLMRFVAVNLLAVQDRLLEKLDSLHAAQREERVLQHVVPVVPLVAQLPILLQDSEIEVSIDCPILESKSLAEATT